MVTIPQEVKNWLLRKHHAHTLKFKRKNSQMKLTSFYIFELSIASASVRDTTSTWLAQVVFDGVVLKDQGPEFLLRFWELSCLDSSLSLSLSLGSQGDERAHLPSVHAIASFRSFQDSLQALSLLRGNRLSAPSVNKFKVGAFKKRHTSHWPTIEPTFHCHTFHTMASYEFGG